MNHADHGAGIGKGRQRHERPNHEATQARRRRPLPLRRTQSPHGYAYARVSCSVLDSPAEVRRGCRRRGARHVDRDALCCLPPAPCVLVKPQVRFGLAHRVVTTGRVQRQGAGRVHFHAPERRTEAARAHAGARRRRAALALQCVSALRAFSRPSPAREHVEPRPGRFSRAGTWGSSQRLVTITLFSSRQGRESVHRRESGVCRRRRRASSPISLAVNSAAPGWCWSPPRRKSRSPRGRTAGFSSHGE